MKNLLEEVAIAFEVEADCWSWRYYKGQDVYEVFRSDGGDPVIHARVATRKEVEHELLRCRRNAAAGAALSVLAADGHRRLRP